MTTLEHSADAFRRALLEHDSVAEQQLLAAYAHVWATIRASLDALLADMAEAEAAGHEITPTWLYRSERYRTLLVQVEQQVGGLARSLNGALQGQAAYAAMLGSQNAADLISAGLGTAGAGVAVSFSRLPNVAVERMVGQVVSDGPLGHLLDGLGTDASATIRRALIVGVATGQNPRVIARLVRDQAGITLTRALTISRTETLRVYRDAALDTYRANSDVVQGWVWHSALGTRTCAFCWSMHGSFHPLSEAFASHPNCRCAPIPETRAASSVTSGVGLFEQLPEARQRTILGPSKYAAYADGRITLEDVRGFGSDPEWGRYGYERSLRDILASRERAAA